MKLIKAVESSDGTKKFLIELDDNCRIGSVAIFHKRTVCACISSQVGCPVGCRFCATGRMGFKRNLYADEIVGQLSLMEQEIDRKFTNVVFMGMGEPLLNYDAVVKAVNEINSSGITWKRITVSTVGIPDKIVELGRDCKCRLAVSLHAPDDVLRRKLVPTGVSIDSIVDACLKFPSTKHNPIMVEYVLIKDVNDSYGQAVLLCSILGRLPFVMVNLIPYNPVPGSVFSRSDRAPVFKQVLVSAGFKAIVRTAKGLDADAACGLLK